MEFPSRGHGRTLAFRTPWYTHENVSRLVPLLRRRFLVAALAGFAMVSTLDGCLSPTLPLPPPENPAVSKIDDEGYVTLTGAPASVEAGALVYGFNVRIEKGQIVRATDYGSYTLRLPAAVGDQITVWQEVGTEQSASILVKVRE
jgi:hypothetical protein